MLVLTIYNCGTDYDRDNRDVIAKLYKRTTSDKFITDGVGSTAKLSSSKANLKEKHIFKSGSFFAAGVDQNVEDACWHVVIEYAEHYRKHNLQINMCGWSRGAVTCFKIANILSQCEDDDIKRIPIRIFAIDPVPGSASIPNWHMWKNIKLTDNVEYAFTILAEYDRRRIFVPVLHKKMWDRSNPDQWSYDTIPGNHAGIVEPKGEYRAASDLVRSWAKRFLMRHETTFDDENTLSDRETLERYAQIMIELGGYKSLGKRIPLYGLFGQRRPRFESGRGKKIETFRFPGKEAKHLQTRRFFANHDHAMVFSYSYTHLFRALNHRSPDHVKEYLERNQHNVSKELEQLENTLTGYYVSSFLAENYNWPTEEEGEGG